MILTLNSLLEELLVIEMTNLKGVFYEGIELEVNFPKNQFEISSKAFSEFKDGFKVLEYNVISNFCFFYYYEH